MKTIKIFLASSGELKEEREQIGLFIAQENKILVKQDIFLELVVWEELLHSFIGERTQNYFNKELLKCDIIIVLFYKKVGQFTKEEFDIAYKSIKDNDRAPQHMLVFFKETIIPLSDVSEEVLEVNKLKREIEKYQLIYNTFETIDSLINKIKRQLDIILKKSKLFNERISNLMGRIDWGDAPDINQFFGRSEELTILKSWVQNYKCKIIAILGIAGIGKTQLSVKLGKGGIGKTDLTLKLAQGIQNEFEYVIWRRLLNAPQLSDILIDIISILSNQKEIDLPDSIDKQISRLLYYLRNHRCLLILDNMEAILQGGAYAGEYREGYENYGNLLRYIGETSHQSCLLITSREKPKDIRLLEGDTKSVRSLALSGLHVSDGKKLFESLGSFNGSDEEWQKIIEFYEGNPLALELAAKSISTVYFGYLSEFLLDGKPIFKDLSELLDWHFERLSNFEKEVMYWLSINREPLTLSELKEDILSNSSKDQLPLTIQSLQNKIPLEKSIMRFTLQPVLIEYMTDKLIEYIGEELIITKPAISNYTIKKLVKELTKEIKENNLDLFNKHALCKATSKDYIREAQILLILKPLINKLFDILGNREIIEKRFKQIIRNIQNELPLNYGYAAGNIINLLCNLKSDLCGYDFSHLPIHQALLHDILLYNVNFSFCDLSKSVFIETFGGVLSSKISHNNELIACGITTGEIIVWNFSNLKHLVTLKGHIDNVWAIDFHPNDEIIASGSDDHNIKLWNINTEECITTLKGHMSWVRSVAFSPDGNYLISGSQDKCVRLWDIKTGQCIKTLIGHKSHIWSVAFSPDNNTFASGSEDNTVRLWNINSDSCIEILYGHRSWVRSVSFSADGNMLVSGSEDKSLRIWDIKSLKCKDIIEGHDHWVRTVEFSPDSNSIISGTEDGIIRLWDIKSKQCIRTFKGHKSRITSLSFHPNESYFVSSSDDQTVRIWDSQAGYLIKTVQGHANPIKSIAVCQVNNNLISGSDDGKIRIWDIFTGKCLNVFSGHKNRIWCVDVSPNGYLLASGSDDLSVRIWNLSTKKCQNILKGHNSWVKSVAFSPNGDLLASSSDDRTVRLWDVKSGNLLKVFEGHDHWVVSVAFDPSGNFIASCSDDMTIRIWDINSRQCLQIIKGHEGPVKSASFNADGKMLASCSDDKTIRIWDACSGCSKQVIKAHDSKVWAVKYSNNGYFLASSSSDETIKIWNIDSFACVKQFRGHSNKIRTIAFTYDSKNIISASDDDTIKIWNVESERCLKTLRSNRPYEKMNITGVTGISESQKSMLKLLGAVEDEK